MRGVVVGIGVGAILALADGLFFAGTGTLAGEGSVTLSSVLRLAGLWLVSGGLVGFMVSAIKNRRLDPRAAGAVALLLAFNLLPFLGATGGQAPTVSVWPGGNAPEQAPIREGRSELRLSLLVVGIDGATWEVIDPMIASGRLPNIASLANRGAAGVLRSEEPTASPVVWTTLFTGKPPEEHGIDDWDAAMSVNRQVKPLWAVLEDAGVPTVVSNVPGTYPAEALSSGLLSGFPFQSRTLNRKGWLAAERPGISGVFRHVQLAFDESGSADISLRDLPADVVSQGSLWFRVLGSIDPNLADAIERRMFERSYIDLRVQSESVAGQTDEGVVTLYPGTSGRCRDKQHRSRPCPALLSLEPGSWSKPLVVDSEQEQLWTVAYLADDGSGAPRILFAPFMRLDDPALMHGAVGDAAMVSQVPYTPELLGWNTFYDAVALEGLAASFPLLVRSRAEYFLSLIEAREARAAITVFTATDRAQHGFWKFRDPDFYWSVEDPVYSSLAPSARGVERYGHVIEDTYAAVDARIGDLLELTDSRTLVVLLSDHGAKSGRHPLSPGAGVHDTAGIYVMARGGVPTNVEIGAAHSNTVRSQELRLLDIMPTLLAGLGVPVARDFDGVVHREALDAAGTLPWRLASTRELPSVASYESGRGHDQGERRDGIDASMKEQLRSLGYLQ